MIRKVVLLLALALVWSSLQCTATVVWDESVDGDLSDVDASPTPITFVSGRNIIIGTVGGAAKKGAPETGAAPGEHGRVDDGYDNYTFTVPSGYRCVDIVLNVYRPTPGNTSTGFNFYLGSAGSAGDGLGSSAVTVDTVGYDLLGEIGTGSLGPGSYSVGIREFTNEDNVYTVDHLLQPLTSYLAVAVMGNPAGPDSWINDVESKLWAQNVWHTVDVFDLEDGIPSAVQMERYNAILAFTDYADAGEDLAAFGDNLADYVDNTGGVVVAMFGVGGIEIEGRFNTDNYWAIQPGSGTFNDQQGLGTVYDPSHPLMTGVSSFDGGSSSYRPASDNTHPLATKIADWSGGTTPLIAVRRLPDSTYGLKRVDLAFYPPSSNVRSDFWDDSTDGGRMMVNALLWVAETCRGPYFADGFEWGDTLDWDVQSPAPPKASRAREEGQRRAGEE